MTIGNCNAEAPIGEMNIEEAEKYVREALHRLEQPSQNARGFDIQIGGVYWRLAKVLRLYAAPKLDVAEGSDHANFIRRTHGVVVVGASDTSTDQPAAAPAPIYQILTEDGAWLDTTPEYYKRVKSDPALARVVYAAPPPPAQADAREGLTDDRRDAIDYAIQVLQQVEAGDGTFVGQCADAIAGLESVLAAHPGQPEPHPKCHGCPINPTCPSTTCGVPQPEPSAEVTLFASGDERDEFLRACQDFDDDGETCVDYGLLMKWAGEGLLECDHFTITKKGRAAIDAARAGDRHVE
ncbi:hypothetical protein H0X90_21570 [Burkholderia sp. 9775_39]|uniref:hypothetical protein n=1 Tax=unclassified Burkholderia TaxID=2613784 RepID=UPI0018C413EA|nr:MULTISPECIES: hypothetical protein [unclassified Burkholderia]MBG0879382.1 hypothetical protein [Burkholderia sp. 9775_39]MBG0884523.1 hypothetical protein [Burkholderia sp. 9773_38]